MKHKVTCPCCKGEKKTVTCEEGSLPGLEGIQTFIIDEKECSHCEGRGVIEAEVGEANDTKD